MVGTPTRQEEEGPVDLPRGKVLGRRWRIKEKLGEGGCGAVYKVVDIRTGISAALKAESNFVAGGPVLKLEVQILRRVKGRKHVTQLLHSGKKEKYSYMVMTLLGDSLQKLTSGKISTVSTQVRVGVQILYGIKQLHEVGYIHRDIKPANLAIGLRGRETHIIHLLDFGLAREYVLRKDNKVEMRHPRTDTLFRGTTRYCSANTHTRNEQGRPDDLWSLIYVIVELRGALPWERLTDKKEIGKAKLATSDRRLMMNCPVQMLDIATHLRTLDYYTRPDYLLIYKKFEEVMKAGGFKHSDPFDWEKPGAASTLTRKLRRTLSISEEVPSEKENQNIEQASQDQTLVSEDCGDTTGTKKGKKTTDNDVTGKDKDPNADLYSAADFEKNEIGF
uniref:Protein kinase domain-containing protein n=1 Tax=Panagrellus redivivus TaxID=6233 RepID=A0A7E4WB58_PANRE